MSKQTKVELPAFPKLDTEAFLKQVQPLFEQLVSHVAQAINNAPDGKIIAGSERQVFDLMNTFKQEVFQTAIQQRLDTAQADFSPSNPS